MKTVVSVAGILALLSGVSLLLPACADPVDLDSPVGTWEYSMMEAHTEHMQEHFNESQMRRFRRETRGSDFVFVLSIDADGTFTESFASALLDETLESEQHGTWTLDAGSVLTATYDHDPSHTLTFRFESTQLVRLYTPDAESGEVREMAYQRAD